MRKSIKVAALSALLFTGVAGSAAIQPTGAEASVNYKDEQIAASNSYQNYQVCQTVNVGPGRRVLNIFYMHSGNGGTYWLEPTAKIENVVFVPDSDLKSWGLNPSKLKAGQIGRATFDSKMWELQRIR